MSRAKRKLEAPEPKPDTSKLTYVDNFVAFDSPEYRLDRASDRQWVAGPTLFVADTDCEEDVGRGAEKFYNTGAHDIKLDVPPGTEFALVVRPVSGGTTSVTNAVDTLDGLTRMAKAMRKALLVIEERIRPLMVGRFFNWQRTTIYFVCEKCGDTSHLDTQEAVK